MISRISHSLYRLSTPISGIAITFLYAGFIAFVMPEQSADSAAYAGDWGAPDRHLMYTPDELYAAISGWNAAGRTDYINFRLGLDILWALAYTGFLVIWMSCALRYACAESDWRRTLNTVPLITLLSDYSENALGILLVSNPANRMDMLAWLASFTTTIKWSSLVIAHLILLYAIALALSTRLKK
jgi:hypothetical protein